MYFIAIFSPEGLKQGCLDLGNPVVQMGLPNLAGQP